jgi:hypothetical protein
MPKVSCSTFTTGARQLVVQEALEMMLCLAGSYAPVVHAQHDGDVFILRRGRNDDLLHRAVQVLHGIFRVRKESGGFHHHFRAQRIPVDLRRVLGGENFDLLVADGDRIGIRGDRFGERSEHGIVFQKVRQSLRIGNVIYRHELHIVPVQACTDNIPANAAEAVNTYFDCHFFSCNK